MASVFRGVFPAASLKHEPHRNVEARLQVFRGVFPAASLKHTNLARQTGNGRFSAGYSPRPH